MILWLSGYIAFINIILFIVMGFDKARARMQGRRVPEKRLWILAVLGGALGMLAGMHFFRHKTKHSTFVYGAPLLFAAQCFLVYYIFIAN